MVRELTENYVWFAVSSSEPPKESRNLYVIEPFKPSRALREMCSSPDAKYWYRASTYFGQVECLVELGNQFKGNLLFFAFTGYDSDFSDMKVVW